MKRHDPIYGVGYDYPPMIINPYNFAAAGGGTLEIADFARTHNATATTHDVNVPSGVASGELLIAKLQQGSGADAQYTTIPSGWTSLASSSSTRAWWRIAGGSEPATYQWILASAKILAAVVLRVTGAHATTPIEGVITNSLDPANLEPSWGTGNYLGITAIGNRNSPNGTGVVTVPTGTTLAAESFASQSDTLTASIVVAQADLTAVSAWDPATFSVAGTLSVQRCLTILVRPV